MKNVVKINQVRLVKSSIKRYQPIGEKQIAIYFAATRTRIDREVFTFLSTEERNEMLFYLDNAL